MEQPEIGEEGKQRGKERRWGVKTREIGPEMEGKSK